MNSWDCFDTLIARRFYHPHSVFDEVGKRLNIPNFKELRIKAELSSDNTYVGIYKNLPGIDPEIEKQVELEHCFPIVENINKVQDGDIIVSDIYHDSTFVEKLLRNCGLTKDVKFIVTADGKSKGWIWSQLPNIKLHIGDNERSDIKSPNKHGISAQLYTETHFTEIEKAVNLYDTNLSLWMRFIRLHCPYNDTHQKLLWIDQANLNLPILLLASFELPDKKIAFTYRDCVFWQPIYEKLTNKKTVRFDSSRICLKNPTDDYKEYVKNTINDCVIVDLQGTGTSLKTFFKDDLPEIYFLTGTPIPDSKIKSITNLRNYSIEKHNTSNQGSIISWDYNGPIRAPVEHPKYIIDLQSKAFDIGLNAMSYFTFNKNKSLLIELLNKTIKNYTEKNVPWIDIHEK